MKYRHFPSRYAMRLMRLALPRITVGWVSLGLAAMLAAGPTGAESTTGADATVAAADSGKPAMTKTKARAKSAKTAKGRKSAATPKAGAASASQDATPVADSAAASSDSSRTDSASAVAPVPGDTAPPATAQPSPAAPATLVFDYLFMERRSQEIHPILMEKKLEIDKAEQQMHELEMGAILPRFQIETGIGPAPGLRNLRDSLSVLPGNQYYVIQNQKDFDFEDWGPFFGIEMTVAQPLNLSRYRAGHKAAAANIKVSEAAFQKEKNDVSEEAQKLYFQRLYAGQMLSVLKDATKELDRAQKKIEGLLDDGDQSVKQSDLLEMKAGRYALEKARNEATLGVARAELGLRFLMQVPDSLALAPKDSVLTLRPESFPSLDSLKMLTLLNHPDLKRLANGLAARRELVRVAKGEIGPDIFLFGSFKYTKAWSTDRQSGGEDPFARDPLNELTGVGGLGMRLNLNFWSRLDKVRKEKIELAQLERTETYAARGLIMKMQDEYIQLLNCRANVTESQKSLRAAEAWLKGAALKYDLDPSTAKDILSPYKTVIGAKRDYFEAVLNYNLAVSKVIKSIGWTLTDYIHNLKPNG